VAELLQSDQRIGARGAQQLERGGRVAAGGTEQLGALEHAKLFAVVSEAAARGEVGRHDAAVGGIQHQHAHRAVLEGGTHGFIADWIGARLRCTLAGAAR